MSTNVIDVNIEYEKDEDLKKEDVKSLQEWAAKQPHLPKISESQFILFLQSCYFSVEKAKNAIDAFFTARAAGPELFSNRDPQLPLFQEGITTACYTMSPTYTKEGYAVLFCTLLTGDANKQHGTAKGFVIVIDTKLGNLGHLQKVGIFTLRKMLHYLQEAMPVRLKAIHVINVVPIVEKLVSIMKPFMNKNLFEILHLHSTIKEDFFQDVPRECLPNEVGGSRGSIKIIQEETNKWILANREFFIQDELLISDESKRIENSANKNTLDFVGTFKKLDID